MKKLIIFCVMLYTLTSVAQEKNKTVISPLSMARMHLDQNHYNYNPKKGFEIYQQIAQENTDAKAMNTLAILYSDGIGTNANQEQAFYWFKKAAESGYSNAWYNLGTMYRKGMGTQQNFELAFASFSKGDELNAVTSSYAKGYLLYKGLGCQQSYTEAIKLFRKSIKKGSLGSMYLLGLCFRNGYGIVQNIDSAKYWISNAANRGYNFAKEELMEAEPEFNGYNQVLNPNKKTKLSNVMEVKNSYEKVKHTLKSNKEIEGIYSGYLLKYDWSGQHVIGKKALEIELKYDEAEQKIKGFWNEDGTKTSLNAILTDSSLLFENTAYSKLDHYSAKKEVDFVFKNAQLQLLNLSDSTYLAGNIQLWSNYHNEPEKPMYVSLVKKANLTIEQPKLDIQISQNLTVYPNPFSNSLSFNILLEKESLLNIALTSIDGKILYTETLKMPTGQQSHTLQANVATGSYVLKVGYNGIVKSSIVIKQ
ncbi:T9SS type A sorting domain-containing protein [Pedobacter aquae]|uniref:T9SS type A sorting domain-containing protein n=1 Tax=Pedobacter aquae TaxID=2605747 RepID=A0A5C0VMI3_9SPHI|nr:T9SS type A sorting domain-containing protein [Pedobacter aquae]QEK52460.1 T9SS type A sorting domain-containing protein [Pedobacter aquae]